MGKEGRNRSTSGGNKKGEKKIRDDEMDIGRSGWGRNAERDRDGRSRIGWGRKEGRDRHVDGWDRKDVKKEKNTDIEMGELGCIREKCRKRGRRCANYRKEEEEK